MIDFFCLKMFYSVESDAIISTPTYSDSNIILWNGTIIGLILDDGHYFRVTVDNKDYIVSKPKDSIYIYIWEPPVNMWTLLGQVEEDGTFTSKFRSKFWIKLSKKIYEACE